MSIVPRSDKTTTSLHSQKESSPEIENRTRLVIWRNSFLLQPLIHHPAALPISAVFGMRYLHALMRRWAASGPDIAKCPEVGTLAVDW